MATPTVDNRPNARQGNRAVTMRDIAARCSVSKWTVSAELRDDPQISVATRARIHAVAEALGYDPSFHAAARRMSLSRHGIEVRNQLIGLVYPADFYSGNQYLLTIMYGILDVLKPQHHGLAIVNSDGDTDLSLPPLFARGEVDGLIGFGGGMRAAFPRLRGTRGFGERPAVSLIEPMDGASALVLDYRQGAYDAAAHLLDLGHRRLLHLTYPDRWQRALDRMDREAESRDPLDRIAGICAALVDRGMKPSEHLDVFPYGPDWDGPQHLVDGPLGGGACGDRLLAHLRANPGITGVLAHNDSVAIHVWHTLRRAGVRVPEDISLVGFDDTDAILDDERRNILSSVAMPLREAGRTAAEHILKRVADRAAPAEEIRLRATVVQRRTSARPGGG